MAAVPTRSWPFGQVRPVVPATLAFRAGCIRAPGGTLGTASLLFTDLKGSTAMYERLGDLNAYALVRQHFTLIADAVQARAGAVVKTIGDAVMAAFFRPEDAVWAALDVMDAVGRFNRERGATDIILKIGIHTGHSIAVTLNDSLDYFGQTVNIAARVEALADAGEICLSETVYTAPRVRDLLSGCRVSVTDAALRGIAGDTRVYRVAQVNP